VTAAAFRGPVRDIPKRVRVILVVGLLYLFLVGVKGLEAGIKTFGADVAADVFAAVSHPISGVCAGILATVLVQSSSVSTATIVGLVGGGALSVGAAVPMIMGANIGTTITSTLAALGHVRQGQEFRRALAGATMHDFFNVITLAVALPLELATGFLSRSAVFLTEVLQGAPGIAPGEAGDSFIKIAVSAPVTVMSGILDGSGLGPIAQGAMLLLFGLALIFVALAFITRNMRLVMAGRFEQSFNALVDRGAGMGAMALGAIMTVMVQSSSITTSILVPMVAAGVLTLKSAFPVTLGANLGTTITALLASLATDRPEALTVALVHTLFNIFGIVVVYPVPAIRNVPMRLAIGLAEVAQRRKRWVVVYVAGVFIVLPLVGVVVLR
jgi:solute carrier family 34 (sodium-dependent phosphate cotransporter)